MHRPEPKRTSYMGAKSLDYLRGLGTYTAQHWRRKTEPEEEDIL